MAKKYQTIKNKISPITIIGILSFILLIVLLLIFLQPSRERTLFEDYRNNAAAQQISFDEKKFGLDHRFGFIDSLDDRWFGLQSGLFTIADRNEVSIVFFGNPNDAASITHIQNVHGLLFGVESKAVTDPSWYPSELYNQLGDQVNLYHFGFQTSGIADLLETLNERYDTKLAYYSTPLVICFINGELVKAINPTGTNAEGITMVRTFYNDILASDAAQALLN